VYDLLLVINSNFGPILHRFGDTAVRTHPSLRNCPLTPIEFRDEPDISRN